MICVVSNDIMISVERNVNVNLQQNFNIKTELRNTTENIIAHFLGFVVKTPENKEIISTG